MSVETGPQQITPIPLEPPNEKRPRRRRRRREQATLDPIEEAARARRRLIRRGIVALIALAVVVAALTPIVLWSRYSTQFVTSRNATVKGSITPVGTQLSGVVAVVEVDAGQRVHAGQVLARFEDHQLQANVLRAQSRLREAMARSSASEARIEAAQSQSNEALVRRDQRIPLAKSGAISLDEMRSAETRLQTSQALERTAVADYNAAGAEVSTAQAEVALARANLEASVIRAPADGWVVRRVSEPGASVIVGQPIVELWIGKAVWVEAWINQDDLSKVAVGNEVKVTVSSIPGRVFRGIVESIGVSTDFELPETAVPQSRNERMRRTPVVPVRVRLDERVGLFPGLSAVVSIQRSGASEDESPRGRR